MTSLTSFAGLAYVIYVSVLWKEYSVQDRFKTLQGIFVILGPGWNAVMSGRMWQGGHWFD